MITEADTGRAFDLPASTTVLLRLSSRWSWAPPTVSNGAVSLAKVAYESDPGFVEWVVEQSEAGATGTATITSRGEPSCRKCSRAALDFSVQLDLTR